MLIGWYHFLFQNHPNKFYKYDCPHLKLLAGYNTIEEVQIIKGLIVKMDFS